ncbi:hypothetical protein GIB67_002998, partial [Kingdonia uniflora]
MLITNFVSLINIFVGNCVICYVLFEHEDNPLSVVLHIIIAAGDENSYLFFVHLKFLGNKDAIQGSEAGKAVSLFILDSFISIDQERFFLNQLQSRGFLRSCLTDISNVSFKDGWPSLDSLQRVYVFEAKLALLLRISYNYGKPGSQVLFSMGTLEHLAACKMMGLQLKGAFRRNGKDLDADFDKQRLVRNPSQ